MRVLALFMLFVPFLVSADRGVGVTPAVLEVQNQRTWPWTGELWVTNFSDSPELAEVTWGSKHLAEASVDPSRFTLGAGETFRVLVRLDRPNFRYGEGELSVQTSRVSSDGLATGTGVKIPVRVNNALLAYGNAPPLAASLVGALSSPIAGMGAGVLVVLYLLARYLERVLIPSRPVPPRLRGVLEPGDTVVFT